MGSTSPDQGNSSSPMPFSFNGGDAGYGWGVSQDNPAGGGSSTPMLGGGDGSPQPPVVGMSPYAIYQRQMDAANERMNSGDQMMLGAYNQSAPQFTGPKFGTSDLLGLLPALLMGGHKQGFPAAGLMYGAGYMQTKEQQAQQAYQRQMEQFQRQEQAKLQAGQMIGNQGVRMGQQADSALHYNIIQQNSAESNIARLNGELTKATPDQVQTIMRQMNSLYDQIGQPENKMSPEAINAYQVAKQKDLDIQNARPAAKILQQQFYGAKTAAAFDTAGQALLEMAKRYPTLLPGLDSPTSVDQIQQMIGKYVPDWQKAEQATTKLRESLSVLAGARTETVNAIRDPTLEGIMAQTWQRDTAAAYNQVLTQVKGINAQYLPAQMQAQTKKLNADVDLIQSQVADNQAKVTQIREAMPVAGLPGPNQLQHSIDAQAQLQASLAKAGSTYDAKIADLARQKALVTGWINARQKDANAPAPGSIPKNVDPDVLLDTLNRSLQNLRDSATDVKNRLQQSNAEIADYKLQQQQQHDNAAQYGGGILPGNADGSAKFDTSRLPPVPDPNSPKGSIPAGPTPRKGSPQPTGKTIKTPSGNTIRVIQ